MSFRSPLGKAKGLGSAKDGTGHFIAQRVTALALIPLVIWVVIATLQLPAMDYFNMSEAHMREITIEWFSGPFNAIMTIFFIIAIFYHGALGMQVVIEDYVHTEWVKIFSIAIINISSFAAATIGIFSILTIYFKG